MKKLSWYHLFIPFLGFLGFIIFVLPKEAEMNAALGLDQSPDTSIFYTKDQLYQLAESYGEEGRAFYVNQRYTFDLIWPLAYGLFLVTAIAYGSQKIKKPLFRQAYWLPVGAVFIDYLENTMTAIVMHRYPKETIILSDLAGIVTALKWLTLTLAFVTLVVMIIIAIYQKLSKGVMLK